MPDELDEFTARAQDGDRTPRRLPSTAAGIDDFDEDFAPQRRSRTVLWVALGAVAVGAVAGVFYAARAGGPRGASAQAGNAAGPSSAPGALAGALQPTLYQERSLTASGYTLRAGLGAAPAQDEPNVLRVFLRDAQGPAAGARIQAALRDGSGRETPLAVRELAGTYLANMDFRIAGRHQIRLLVEPRQGGRLETQLDFEVAAPSPPAPPEKSTAASPSRSTEASRPHRRSGDKTDKTDKSAIDVNSLPVTVIPPDPIKTPPRQPGPAAVTKPAASPPVVVPTTGPAASGSPRAPAPAASPPPTAHNSAPAASPPPAPAPSPPPEPAPRPAQPAGDEQDPYRILNNQ